MSSIVELACRKDPDLFFSTNRGKQERAKRMCLSCPIVKTCLENCLEYEDAAGQVKHGVFGGTDEQQRAAAFEKRRSA